MSTCAYNGTPDCICGGEGLRKHLNGRLALLCFKSLATAGLSSSHIELRLLLCVLQYFADLSSCTLVKRYFSFKFCFINHFDFK